MTKIAKLSHTVWPVSAIPALGTNDNAPEQDSARKGPAHEALAAEFSRNMSLRAHVTSAETTATISNEGRALLAAEQNRALKK